MTSINVRRDSRRNSDAVGTLRDIKRLIAEERFADDEARVYESGDLSIVFGLGKETRFAAKRKIVVDGERIIAHLQQSGNPATPISRADAINHMLAEAKRYERRAGFEASQASYSSSIPLVHLPGADSKTPPWLRALHCRAIETYHRDRISRPAA
ncbi:hypothetical protein CYMTET_37351 [Cymbomonas tetramitiformis]|uniref:Uncharacterized protein n=1 Tax=Cymbomonas tetramitiformis TaxID=36881 RepID=A0AAE0CE01_9CHLO|nr:hypothetical protein CYMTET_37351 [Cymbomonas tetramitiformis]